MRFTVDGRELSAEGLRVGEICEAEKYLQLDMDSGSGAKIAVALYVAKKRDEPAMFPGAVAEWVMNVDMTSVDTLEEEDEESPPAGTVAKNGSGDRESLLTSGPQPLGKSA